MAEWKKRNGEIVFFKSDKERDDGANATGSFHYNEEDYTVKVFRDKPDGDESKKPDYRGEIDMNGTRLKMALWLKGFGEQENKRPNFTGTMEMDGFKYNVALWERKAKATGNLFWSGLVNLDEKDRKPIQSGGSNSSSKKKVIQEDLDDEVPF